MELNKEKINAELKRRGWTKYHLAMAMGVNRQWIYQALSEGYKGMTLATVTKIAVALDYDPKDLLI